MQIYRTLRKQVFTKGGYSLVPLRFEDRFIIMKWRNEQLYHLRQGRPLTSDDQDHYFNTIVANLFGQEHPEQLLFSYLKEDLCIGYGGLVHINWKDLNAEISFLIDTRLEKDFFEFHWSAFLSMIKEVAFEELRIHKIYTYAFDLRPHLYNVVEKAGFKQEARLKEHCFFDGRFIDVVIHSLIYPNISIRQASLDDMETTFQWANNEQIRSYSYNQASIPWEDHKNWFTRKVANPEKYQYYIMQCDETPIGSIRFDIDASQSAKISYLLHPDYHGKGFGKFLLEKGTQKLIDANNRIQKLIGLVHRENVASLRLFKKMNFSENHTESVDFVQFELQINEATQ